MTESVLVVGGYGDVGAHLSAELHRGGHPVTIAGRSAERATAQARALGAGASARALDVDDAAAVRAALHGVDVVIGCIDQRSPHLLEEAIARGLTYLDVTAGRRFIEAGLASSGRAERTGARVLLASGLTPGLINVMAAACSDAVGGARAIETHALFGAGDAYGGAALRFMLAAVPVPYRVTIDGAPRTVRCLEGRKRVVFPPPFGARTLRRFAYPDQFFYPRTLGVHTSVSWFALDPAWVTAATVLACRLGGRAALRSSAVRERLRRGFEAASPRFTGRDSLAFVVEARGPAGEATAAVVGRGEGRGTAISAARMLDQLLRPGDVPPGVHLPEQVVRREVYLPAMAARGWSVEVTRPRSPR